MVSPIRASAPIIALVTQRIVLRLGKYIFGRMEGAKACRLRSLDSGSPLPLPAGFSPTEWDQRELLVSGAKENQATKAMAVIQGVLFMKGELVSSSVRFSESSRLPELHNRAQHTQTSSGRVLPVVTSCKARH